MEDSVENNLVTINNKLLANPLVSALQRVVGGSKQNLNAGNRGLPYSPVIYIFHIEITDAMREKKTQKERHLLAWEAIFRQESKNFIDTFNINRKRRTGLETKLKKTDKWLSYKMFKSIYIGLPYPNKLMPFRVDGATTLYFEDRILKILRGYDESTQILQKDKLRIIEEVLGYIVTRIKSDKFEENPDTTRMLDLMEDVSRQLTTLDDRAMISLIDEIYKTSPEQKRQVAFSTKDANRSLQLFLIRLNVLNKSTETRAKKHAAVALDFQSSKVKLQKLEDGYRIYRRMMDKKSALSDDRKLKLLTGDYEAEGKYIVTVSDIDDEDTAKEEKKIKQLTEELETYLANHNISSIKKFEALIDSFETSFEKVTVQLALDVLSEHIRLLKSEFKQRIIVRPAYFKDLYNVLSDPQLKKHVEIHFPIIKYSGIDVVKLHAKVAADKTISNPKDYFSGHLTNEIHEKIRFAKKAWGIIDDKPSKIWGLPPLLEIAYHRFEIAEHSIYRTIIEINRREKAKRNVVEGLIWAAVVLALSVIPGVGAVALLATGVVTAVGVRDVYMTVQENVEGRILQEAGLSSEAPSGWWIVLAIVGAAGDVSAFTKIAKQVAGNQTKFLKQIEEARIAGNLDQHLLRKEYVDAPDFTDKIKKLLNTKSDIKDSLERIKDNLRLNIQNMRKSVSVMGSNLAFDPMLWVVTSRIAYHLFELGITKFDDFVTEIRVIIAQKNFLDDDVVAKLKEVHEAAKKNQGAARKSLAVVSKAQLEAETISWLKGLDGISTAKINSQLRNASNEVIESVNVFRKSNGFDQVVKNWFAKGNQQKGARFVMRFSIHFFREKADDIIFEAAALKRRRIMDIQADGIKYELKSVKDVDSSLVIGSKSKNTRSQLERDLMLLLSQEGPESLNNVLRWVFDKASLPDGYTRSDVVARIGELLEKSVFKKDKRLADIKELMNHIVVVWELPKK